MEDVNSNLKRTHSKCSESNAVYCVKKRRKLRLGCISVPLNDEYDYGYALVTNQVFPVPPSASGWMEFAAENGLLNRVVYGSGGNRVIEGLILDGKTGIPWQVPTVRIKYKRIDYASFKQPHTQQVIGYEEPPVSPKSIGSANPGGPSTDLTAFGDA